MRKLLITFLLCLVLLFTFGCNTTEEAKQEAIFEPPTSLQAQPVAMNASLMSTQVQSDSCVICHTSSETIEKLAAKPEGQAEATGG